jgi:hypothetical protein
MEVRTGPVSSKDVTSGRAPAKPQTALLTLRRLAQSRQAPVLQERCELCEKVVPARHRHLFELATRQIRCACDGCALTFERVVCGRFKLIPRDVRPLAGFELNGADWDALALPIQLAFLYRDGTSGKPVAMYPSPAGAIQALLPWEAWNAIQQRNPVLNSLVADVEALLIYRIREPHEYFLVPIDRCFELAGLIRLRWRGLSGGEAVWEAIDEFLANLRVEGRVERREETVNHA